MAGLPMRMVGWLMGLEPKRPAHHSFPLIPLTYEAGGPGSPGFPA